MALTEKEIADIRLTALADPVKFCKIFLPHWFPGEIPWVHRGLMAILTKTTDWLPAYGEMDKIARNFIWREVAGDPDSRVWPMFQEVNGRWKLIAGQFSCFMLPRGFAKTTICNAMMLRWILYKEINFGLYTSESERHAETQLTSLKSELANNGRILQIFGPLKPDRNSDLTWQAGQFETTHGVFVAARGRGGQVRGLLHKGSRPDRIIMDDVEDLESVSTEEQRIKARTWALQELLPCLPAMDQSSMLVALGTLLHRDSLMARLATDPQFTSVVFGARDLQGGLLWAENMDEEKLEAKKASYVNAGNLAGYYMEYHNEIRLGAEAPFRPEFINHSVPDTVLKTGVAIDPAISEKRGSSKAAIAVVGISPTGRIWVLETWSRLGASPREQIDQFFAMSARWSCTAHGVEAIAFQAALVHLMQEEMFRKHQYLGEITKITHQQRKEDRINGVLQPRYASGYIHHRIIFQELETQLLDFPSGSMDILDAVAMAVSLLDPWAAHAAGKDLGEDEYEPLNFARGAP